MEKIKCLLAVFGGVIGTLTDQYAVIFGFVIFGIVFDTFTGLIKAKVSGIGWSSKKGSVGFWKKIADLIALCFGVFLDSFIPVALEAVSIELPFKCPFGLIIGVYIVLNESISICENLYEINPVVMPKWIVKLLKTTSEKIEKEDVEK